MESTTFEGLMSRCTSRVVGVLQAQGRLADQFAGLGHGERPAAADHLFQVQPVQKLHHQEPPAVDLAGVMGDDDIGMLQGAAGLHFAFEAGDGPGVVLVGLGRIFRATSRLSLVCRAL